MWVPTEGWPALSSSRSLFGRIALAAESNRVIVPHGWRVVEREIALDTPGYERLGQGGSRTVPTKARSQDADASPPSAIPRGTAGGLPS